MYLWVWVGLDFLTDFLTAVFFHGRFCHRTPAFPLAREIPRLAFGSSAVLQNGRTSLSSVSAPRGPAAVAGVEFCVPVADVAALPVGSLSSAFDGAVVFGPAVAHTHFVVPDTTASPFSVFPSVVSSSLVFPSEMSSPVLSEMSSPVLSKMSSTVLSMASFPSVESSSVLVVVFFVVFFVMFFTTLFGMLLVVSVVVVSVSVVLVVFMSASPTQ